MVLKLLRERTIVDIKLLNDSTRWRCWRRSFMTNGDALISEHKPRCSRRSRKYRGHASLRWRMVCGTFSPQGQTSVGEILKRWRYSRWKPWPDRNCVVSKHKPSERSLYWRTSFSVGNHARVIGPRSEDAYSSSHSCWCSCRICRFAWLSGKSV